MPLIDIDRFAITRDDVTRRVTFLQIREHMGAGVTQADRLEDDDWFIFNRNNVDCRIRWSTVLSAVQGNATNIRDTDWLLVNRNQDDFRVSFLEFFTQLRVRAPFPPHRKGALRTHALT